jgi:NADPH2:quinone reductase
MRAVVCTKWGTPDDLRLGSVPEPLPRDSEVVIEVAVCTANFADVLMIGGNYQTRPALPFTPGLEAAGTVVHAPPQSNLREGDRVVAFLWHGGFAEKVCAAAVETFAIPPRMPFEHAAALTSTYASAALAIVHSGRLEPSDTLLVLGAGGGAGSAAVQIGKALGARVIAVASSPEKQSQAHDCGADLVIGSLEADWQARVMSGTGGRGVDVCFDPVGGRQSGDALAALAWGGRHIIFGFASGEIPAIKLNRLLVRNRALLGSSLRHYRLHDPERLRATMAQLFEWWEQGGLRPCITRRYPLGGTAAALRSIAERRAIGKIAIFVDETAMVE